MDPHHVITKLRQHEGELRAAGVVHLHLFGSVARDEGTSASGVDLMAEFDATRKLSLFDMVGLENRLSDLLQVKVDITQAKTMKEHIRETANRESVLVF